MTLDNFSDKYQTIGARFLALIIDGIVILPITMGTYYAATIFEFSSLGAYIGNVLIAFISALYTILLHGFYGQTIGKRITNVKVVDISEKNINLGQATLRYAPNLIPLLILIGFGHPNFSAGNVSETDLYLGNFANNFGGIFLSVWNIADIIVCLASSKHRALHDFIAGTVVIKTNV